MPNITLRVDEKVIKKVKKIAIEKDTTMTAMIRNYLATVAASDEATRRQAVKQLQTSFTTFARDMDGTWNREELHERS